MLFVVDTEAVDLQSRGKPHLPDRAPVAVKVSDGNGSQQEVGNLHLRQRSALREAIQLPRTILTLLWVPSSNHETIRREFR